MKKPFTTKSLQSAYVFRFKIHNHNFTCKLVAKDRGFGDFFIVPYLSYHVTIYSSVLRTIELPYLLCYSSEMNYRLFRNFVQREVTSYVSSILFN